MVKILAQAAITLPSTNGSGSETIDYPGGFTDFGKYFSDLGSVIGRAIPFVFAIAGIGLLIMIIGAGFTLLTSAGDAKKMEEGRQKLTYAIVGFVVIFAAYWIVQLLGIVTGMDFIGGGFK